ncbi:uncharacterized protein LOC126566717 [Anopheles maculipalpis]|uniref:uncharacterized protein LOC126566717 n=1 Tax=Anopheles maculipalpis TaxID=1496333 RepID=UPI00215968BE|nr:uncharacterized protein LOC126566717 [Anopheles maculipalpis]
MSAPETVSDIGENVPTLDYLKELLNKAIELEAAVEEKQQERQTASSKLDAVWANIHQAIVKEAELKRKHRSQQANNNAHQVHEHSKDVKEKFTQQFNQLQRVMGISIVCIPEQKQVEITYNDVHKTKVTLSYSDKEITLDAMYPTHPNEDAIRTHLRETGDLVGFLSVLRKKLTFKDM